MHIATKTAPHYDAPKAGAWSVTVDDLAYDGLLIADEYPRVGSMELRYAMSGEYFPRDTETGERGGWEYTPVFVGAAFKGRYLSPMQCAAVMPREIRIEANDAARRAAVEYAE